MNVCIILARKESKRLPGKNKRDFMGKPIIEYSIECARKSGVFDLIIIYTDDIEIMVMIPMNKKIIGLWRESATDNQTMIEAINEVISKLNEKPDYICCIYACAPLLDKGRNAGHIYDSYQILDKFDYNYLIAMNGNKEAGAFFWMKIKYSNIYTGFKECPIIKCYSDTEKMIPDQSEWNNIYHYPLQDIECQDIDTEEDWKKAEDKWKILNPKEYQDYLKRRL